MLTKKEAAEYLGVTPRTLERYTREKRLEASYVPGKHGYELRYRRGDLDALTGLMDSRNSKPRIGSRAGASSLSLSPQASLGIKLLLTLEEAEQLTGLDQSHLTSAIESGDLRAVAIAGCYRIKRHCLESYIANL